MLKFEPVCDRKRFALRHALERGPLGGLAAPETGFVWDAAREVWGWLDLNDKVALYLASWPFDKLRWRLLTKYVQGRRVEYGPFRTNEFGFGSHTHKGLTLVGFGYTVDLDYWLVMDDYEQLGKLFRLLKRYGGLKGDEARHSKSVNDWRAALVRLL